MENKLIFKTQKYITILYLVVAIAAFVYSLGFITNFYRLFFDGKAIHYQYYKEQLQPFNSEIYKASLTFILFAILLMVFEVQKHVVGILGLITTLVTTLYTSYYAFTFIGKIADLKTKYNAMDLTTVKNYKPSNFTFDLGNVLYIASIVISVLLLISVVINNVKKARLIKKEA